MPRIVCIDGVSRISTFGAKAIDGTVALCSILLGVNTVRQSRRGRRNIFRFPNTTEHARQEEKTISDEPSVKRVV
jgi:hypothetical protein